MDIPPWCFAFMYTLMGKCWYLCKTLNTLWNIIKQSAFYLNEKYFNIQYQGFQVCLFIQEARNYLPDSLNSHFSSLNSFKRWIQTERTDTALKSRGLSFTKDLNFSGIPMEVFLILIHIVLFSSDNLDPFQSLVHKQNIENIQTEYMLFLHRWVRKSDEKNRFCLLFS